MSRPNPFRIAPFALVALAALTSPAARAEDTRDATIAKSFKLEVVKKGVTTKPLVVTDIMGSPLGQPVDVGKPGAFDQPNFKYKLKFDGTIGWSYDLKFSFEDNVNFYLHVEDSKNPLGDWISVAGARWDGLITKVGKETVSTRKGTSLLVLNFKK